MKENKNFKGLVRKHLAKSSVASNLNFNEQVKAMMRDGRDIHHFAFGQSPFPIPECLTQAVQEYAHAQEYLPMAGTLELREAVVRFHLRYDNFHLQRDNLVVGPGSKELIYLTLVAFNGDILLPAPAWTTYAPQCHLAGKKPITLQTDQDKGWKLTPKTLHEATREGEEDDEGNIKWKLLILTNPGNPTGACYTEEELEALSVVCRQRNILVLSDEIYARLTFSRKHASMVKVYPEGTILTSGFSKWASAGGWRLGYAHFPSTLSPLLTAVLNAGSHTYSCAPAPIQHGVAKALKQNALELDQYMGDCAKILQAVGDYCHRELSSVGVTGPKSQGAYYFMPNFEVVRAGLKRRGLTTGDHMTQAILEEANVALMSSRTFLRPAEELTTRFCFVCFDGGAALRALRTLPDPSGPLPDSFLQENCQNLVKGVENLKQWVLRHTR